MAVRTCLQLAAYIKRFTTVHVIQCFQVSIQCFKQKNVLFLLQSPSEDVQIFQMFQFLVFKILKCKQTSCKAFLAILTLLDHLEMSSNLIKKITLYSLVKFTLDRLSSKFCFALFENLVYAFLLMLGCMISKVK